MNRMRLVLGDWSKDGHNQSDEILVDCSHTVARIQTAYKKSCKLTGIQFNSGTNYTGIKREYRDQKKYEICTEYEEREITPECLAVLEKFEYPKIRFAKTNMDTEVYTDMWFWFVGLSLKDFKWNLVKDNEIPRINGYWDKNLNAQFGYALYN